MTSQARDNVEYDVLSGEYQIPEECHLATINELLLDGIQESVASSVAMSADDENKVT